jgi:phage/plasmid-associated DNA primase
MIDGCAEWQGEGLQQPEAVRSATDAYLSSEDSIAEWISDRCTTNANDSAPSSALFKNWEAWANAAGEHVGSNKWFSSKLEDRGFVKVPTNTGKRFFGIAPVPPPTPPPWEPDR